MVIDVKQNQSYVFGNYSTTAEAFSRTIVDEEKFVGNAGIRIRFKTNSKKIEVLFEINAIDATALIGSSLTNHITYVVYDEKKLPIKQAVIVAKNDYLEIYNASIPNNVYCELYLPSINTVNNIFIKVDNDAEISPYLYAENKPIIFLGGKLTLGYGCVFAQAMYSQIVSRKLNRNFYNFAKDAHNFYSLHAALAIKELKPSCIVSEITTPALSPAYCKAYLNNYLECLVSNGVPVVLISQPYWGDTSNGYKEKRELLESALKAQRNNGKLIAHIDGEKIFKNYSYDCFSYSLYFINEFANSIIAKEIINAIESLL